MRKSIRVSIIFVLIWFIGKILFFNLQLFQDEKGVKIQVFWNLFCLLFAMTLGIYLEKKEDIRTKKIADSTALEDMKRNMASGLLYTVFVSILLYFYYTKIDPSYNQRQIAIAEQKLIQTLDNPKELAKIHAAPEYKSKTRAEILKMGMDNQRAIFSPGFTMTVSLLGLLVLSTLNAIILTYVFRRLLFKQ